MKKLLFSQVPSGRAQRRVFAPANVRSFRSGSQPGITQGSHRSDTGPALRVLHIEDNTNDAELVATLLQGDGLDAQIERVETRNEFNAALRNGSFDVILSDFSLPTFDGKAALALARERCPATPFLFVSGTLGEDAAIESLKNGATDYVVKNKLSRLVPAIQRALREKQEQSQRREAEEDLRRSGELFRQIMDNVADLIAVLDNEGRWLYTSPSYRSILSESALQPGVDAFAEVHPEDREAMRGLFRTMLETGIGQRAEFRFLVKNGSNRFIESQSSLIRDEDGKITNVVTVSRDITQRKQTEERMQQIQGQLEHTNQDLLKKNEEIQSFYHTLSHELKTPLTSAREFIAIVMDGLAGTLNETQFEYLRIAKESCNQLRVCLNDLLDTTRLETGKLRIDLKPASLANLVQQVMTMMSPVAAGKKIRLSKQVQAGLPDVLIDENRITQVITNLLNNALKFTPEEGKINIKVSEAPDHPEFVQVAISDTGRGIPADQLDRIFDRLYQIKAGDAAIGKGIGLGLYICRELVDLHGGHIWVQSELNQGSTFTFELPKQPQVKKATVLVVDDDPTVREVIRQALENAEFKVVCADGGNEAIRLMHGQLPNVILIDLDMPDLDGAAALKEIRRTWGPLPVIVHTAYPDSEMMQRALESSPFTVLAKPCEERQLIDTVRMVLRQSETAIWTRQTQSRRFRADQNHTPKKGKK